MLTLLQWFYDGDYPLVKRRMFTYLKMDHLVRNGGGFYVRHNIVRLQLYSNTPQLYSNTPQAYNAHWCYDGDYSLMERTAITYRELDHLGCSGRG